MPVIGRHAQIILDTGWVAEVNPFTPDYKAMNVPIVDAAIQYDCQYDDRTYMLVIQNALHVLSMSNNLIPPFILLEAGITVNDTPKIQLAEPTIDDHCLYFAETYFRIPLGLRGVSPILLQQSLEWQGCRKQRIYTSSHLTDGTLIYMCTLKRRRICWTGKEI